MNVSIKTPFAEMSFEMSPDRAKNLIRVAVQLASSEDEAPHLSGLKCADPPEELRPEPEPQKPTRSRVESMFGARETWSTPAAAGGREEERESYKGFLFIRCEACGKEKGYSSKYPLTFHKCDCGHRTDLHDLKPVHLYCKCGSKYKYMTNISDPQFTMNCLSCGAPVDLELNSRGTAYVTIGHKIGGGVLIAPMYSGRSRVFTFKVLRMRRM